MARLPSRSWWLPCLVGIAVGWVLGAAGGLPVVARQQPLDANPQTRALDANLWLQTSGEFRALCLQVYRNAGERLKVKLLTAERGGKPPAVVMDLDETVFDNSPFQSWLYRNKQGYADPLWEKWEKDFPGDVRLVPGAKTFIEEAESLGVMVVYLSNRLTKHADSTVEALRQLGLGTAKIQERLLLKEGTSDKTARRKVAEDKYAVLMYFGDNLRDFSEEFAMPRLKPDDVEAQRKAIADRLAQVERRADKWGADWIVLPNPCYGEWTKPFGNDPSVHLNSTRMPSQVGK